MQAQETKLTVPASAGTADDVAAASAGTADDVAAASAVAAVQNETQKSCQTAGKENNEMSDTTNTNQGEITEKVVATETAAVTAATQPETVAVNVGAQAQAGTASDVPGAEQLVGDSKKVKGKKGRQKRTGEAGAEKKKPCESVKEKAKPVMILFRDLGISQWNESFGTKLDETHVRDLMGDISKNKLMHPVTLTCGKDLSGPKFTILTGARRVAALELLRGPDSGLRIGEFKIHENLDENNLKCLDYSLAENTHRYGRNVIDRAVFIGRMIRENKVDQTKLAAKFNMRREVVNRLDRLSKNLGELPESWRKDLSYSPKSGGKEPKKADLPKITLTHWVEIAGKIGDGVISPEVRAIMDKAHAKRWSASRLRRELNGKGVAAEGDTAAKVVSVKEAKIVKLSLAKLCKRLQGKAVEGDEALSRVMAAIGDIAQQADTKKAEKAKKAAVVETPAVAEVAAVKVEVAAGSEAANGMAA